MKKKLEEYHDKWLRQVPEKYASVFWADCIEVNLRRFAILPYFSIVTQIACVFIYLYVYPTVFPEKPEMNHTTFLLFSTVYIVINFIGGGVINYLKDQKSLPNRLRKSEIAVYIYLMFYVALEASQVVVELEISGNIYRFLATFFAVAFFPVVGRKVRLAFMAGYILISEICLIYLQSAGIQVYSYPEINAVVFLVCLVGANIYYNGVISNFVLHMDLIEKTQQLEYLSSKDSLTGLSNRRSLSEHMEQSWQNALRCQGALGILMMDIDNFKNFNDTYGHQAGDDCLAKVAQCIDSGFNRAIDMTARYGGEEFVAVIGHTTMEDGLALAERVRASVEQLDIRHEHNPPWERVTVSVGVAVAQPQVGESYEKLIKAADEALYAAKQQGRNRVEAAIQT